MTYIAPDSVVEYYSDLGLSDKDTLFFNSEEEKNDFFSSMTPLLRETDLSFVHKTKGVLRSAHPVSQLYNAGYMRFRNTAFSNKWFYAYIDDVEYSSNGMTEISFTIDPIMTHMGNFSLGECFIERQHTISDAIGANIADEGLETGPYITESENRSLIMDDYEICIFTTENSEGEIEGKLNGGIFDGTFLNRYITVEAANGFLQSFASNYDDVLAIMMLPSFFIENIESTETPKYSEVNITKPYQNVAGYTPKNNKLFCYPYKFLTVYNSDGESSDYMYEYFNTLPDQASGGSCGFEIHGIASTSPQIICVPKSYMGQAKNYGERVTIKNFPMCSWNVDAYKAYLAQTQASLPASLLSGAVNMSISGALSGAGLPATAGATAAVSAVNLASSVFDQLAKKSVYNSMPNISKGVQDSDVMVGLKAKDFYFYCKTITKNYAMMIDSYFDMFGYAIRQHGVPNMSARPHWTYVKTRGCVIHGNLPADDANAIAAMFDNGIRFWKNLDEIGNYNLDNSPS